MLYITQTRYLNSIRDLLAGNISFEDISQDSIRSQNNSIEFDLIKPNTEDSLLRINFFAEEYGTDQSENLFYDLW